MISRRIRTTSAAAALFTAAAVGIPTAAWAAAPANSATAATAAPTVTPAGSGQAGVVLPTGDRIVVGTGTGANAGLAVDHSAGASDAFASFRAGGDQYVIPSEATPYMGRSLDLSLFDVTKLAASAPNPGAHIPVQLSFAAGVTPTAPAGVTLTSVSGQTAAGYLTPDSGRAFAQALRDAIKADVAAGHKAGTAPLFGGLTSMTAPGAAIPIQPHYPLHILQLNTLDTTGAPSNVMVILMNTDNAKMFTGMVFSSDGIAKVAVPAGNYTAMTFDSTFDSQAHTASEYFVAQDGVSVPATGAVPVATIDERAATSQVTFTTQKPSSQVGGYLLFTRKDPNGVGAGVTLFGGGGQSTYVSPVAKPTTGSLDYALNWVGASPAAAASPYRYNLGATAHQISANQSYTVADSSLATLHHTFDLDPAYGTNPPDIGSAFITPDGWGLTATPATSPLVTEYVTGGLQWFTEMALPQVPSTTPNFSFAFLDDDPLPYRAGQTASRNWAYAPEVPNLGQHPAASSDLGCQACAAGGNLNVYLGMLGDSHRDTTGMDFTAAGTSQLYWNGKLVSSDTDHFGYLVQNVPAGPATLRTVFDFDRTGDGVTQSSKTHTDLTIPYSGQDDPRMVLPSTVQCVPAEAAGTPTAPCQILPALTLNYQLIALDGRNTSHSPAQNLLLNVGHMSYGGVGSRAHIDSAQVSVSFDNGATWKDVPTHGFDGTYVAHWANPAAGSPIELRVTATDCLGGSITQTITNPYTVGATS